MDKVKIFKAKERKKKKKGKNSISVKIREHKADITIDNFARSACAMSEKQ